MFVCVCRLLQAAMKAVVATSRMHEGSRRRTDSCEMPGSGTSRHGSLHKVPPPESSSSPSESVGPTSLETTESAPSSSPTPSEAACSAPPGNNGPSSKPPSDDDVTATGSTRNVPSRPPLRADGLRQLSVITQSEALRPRPPLKSCSVIGHTTQADVTATQATPPNPNNLSNGFLAVEAEKAGRPTNCQ